MTLSSAPTPAHLGFLTILHSDGGTLGGFLVTNLWGRPVEFRLSTAVQPNKVQQLLYGPSLGVYLSAELIGKTLVEKSQAPAGLILTDVRDALELRRHVATPVVWVAPPGHAEAAALAAAGLVVREAGPDRGAVLVHPDFAEDLPAVRELFARLGGSFDPAEPFTRVRDAVAEARKLGGSQRVA